MRLIDADAIFPKEEFLYAKIGEKVFQISRNGHFLMVTKRI